jgi:general stress protein CsbA
LVLLLLGLFGATLASTPWCVEMARDLLKDINSTTMGQMYAGYEPIQMSDTLVYSAVGVALFLTFLVLLFGVISIIKENFICCIIFALTLFLCVAASACCYTHTLFLINMIVDVILGVLTLFFSILIKRADRLAPESLTPDDISKAKTKQDLEAEHLTENENGGGDDNLRV